MAVIAGLDPRDISSGLATAMRAVKDFDVSDSLDAIRRTDVRRGIDPVREVVEEAAGAVIESVAEWQGRGQRRWRRPALFVLLVGIIAAVASAAWWRHRRAALVAIANERLDLDALDRAADEGMGTAVEAQAPTVDRPESILIGVA